MGRTAKIVNVGIAVLPISELLTKTVRKGERRLYKPFGEEERD